MEMTCRGDSRTHHEPSPTHPRQPALMHAVILFAPIAQYLHDCRDPPAVIEALGCGSEQQRPRPLGVHRSTPLVRSRRVASPRRFGGVLTMARRAVDARFLSAFPTNCLSLMPVAGHHVRLSRKDGGSLNQAPRGSQMQARRFG
jgi:hypothetical protein